MGGAEGAGSGGGRRVVIRWRRRRAGWVSGAGRSVVRARRMASGWASRSSQAATPGARVAMSASESVSTGAWRRRSARSRAAVRWRAGVRGWGSGVGAGLGERRGRGRRAGLRLGARLTRQGRRGGCARAVVRRGGRRCHGARGLVRRRCDRRVRPVVRLRTRAYAAVPQAYADAAQVARRLQLAQRGRDPHLALREARGEHLDADFRALGQRLDVDGEPDREEGQFAVLCEVVADDREAGRVAGVDVDDTGGRCDVVRRPGGTGRGARGRDSLLGSHREGLFFLGGQALAGVHSPGRGQLISGGCCREHMPDNRPQIQLSCHLSPARVISVRTGFGWVGLGSFPGFFQSN